jgi:hypothetical protein
VPTEPQPVTVADVIHRAVEVCELGEPDESVDELLQRFEDADEPVAGLEDFEVRLDEEVGKLDPEQELPSLQMARAVAVYLAHRRDELDNDAETLLRLAARAEFDGHPPPAVRDWMAGAGVSL